MNSPESYSWESQTSHQLAYSALLPCRLSKTWCQFFSCDSRRARSHQDCISLPVEMQRPSLHDEPCQWGMPLRDELENSLSSCRTIARLVFPWFWFSSPWYPAYVASLKLTPGMQDLACIYLRQCMRALLFDQLHWMHIACWWVGEKLQNFFNTTGRKAGLSMEHQVTFTCVFPKSQDIPFIALPSGWEFSRYLVSRS